ncbi:MAG: CRISPR-associated helicase Cas3' [Candidatus Bathyarchaeia archaeon]
MTIHPFEKEGDEAMKMHEREFQQSAFDVLKNRQSTLIIAPTGLGKTRAALLPFIKNLCSGGLIGTRLIYSLPLRALTKGVVEELEQLCPTLKPVVHHGDEPESEFFSERAIVTTIDQYFTAFAGAPLSWASHLSHAAAGAVLTSYSVFDEVHLLSPQRGLPLLFAILYLRQRWGLLSCVMTATLPPSIVKFFEKFCSLEKIEATTNDIAQRDSWRKVRLQLIGRKADNSFSWDEKDPEELAQLVKERWQNWGELDVDGPKKVIVFVNTVDRAIQVYRKLQNFCPNVILAHSRFTKEDRKRVEECLHDYFGKGARSDEAILITTQVAEAGLNISAPLVITEVCPMDSLIQRAGRCQRFKPNNGKEMRGLVLVVKPKTEEGKEWHAPYLDSVRVQKNKRKGTKNVPIVQITLVVLERQAGNNGEIKLNWELEKQLIESALDDAYCAFLNGSGTVNYEDVKDKPLGTAYDRVNGKKGAEEELEQELPEMGGEEHGEEEIGE